jgi:enoyl-CoA hydratase/carnithine racemase
VLPPDRLLGAVGEAARVIAANAPLAVRSAKQVVPAATSVGLDARLDLEATHQRGLFETTDFREGIAAIRDRRPP